MTSTKIEVILEAMINLHGSDFTSTERTRDNVYARSCFFTIVKNMFGKELPLRSIGDFCNRNHSSVIHNLKQHESYMFVREYRKMFSAFDQMVSNLMDIKEPEAAKTYTEDLVDEIDMLKSMVKELTKKVDTKSSPDSFIRDISNLPADLKREFEQYKWIPFKKMLQSREHYNFVINTKKIY